MKKITSIVLSVSMAAGALGMNSAVVHAEESAKKVAYIVCGQVNIKTPRCQSISQNVIWLEKLQMQYVQEA